MLAVAMDERHPQFPDVPTFKELGIDMSSGAYRGVAVPESTPEELRKQISGMIHEINQDPEFRQRLENDGMAMLDVGYEQMDAFMAKMRSEEHTSELQSLMRISYAVFCLKKKKKK